MANTDTLTPEQMLGVIDRSLLELAKSQEAQAKSIKNLSKIINKNFTVINSSMARREQRDAIKERRLKSEPQEITLSKKTLMQLKKLDQSERFDALLKEVRKQPKQSEGFFSKILGPIGLLLGGVAALGFGVGKFPLVKQLFQNFQKTGVYQAVSGFLSKFNKTDEVLKEWIRGLPLVGRLIDLYDAFKLIGQGQYKQGLKQLAFAVPGAEFIANLMGIKKEQFLAGEPTTKTTDDRSLWQKIKDFFNGVWESIVKAFTPSEDSNIGKFLRITKNFFTGKTGMVQTLKDLSQLFPSLAPIANFVEDFDKTDIKAIWNEAFKTGGKSGENTELVNSNFSKFISNIADNFAKLSKLLDSVANIFTGVMNYLSSNADERAQGEAQLKEHAPDLLSYLQFFRTIAEYIEAANKDGIRGIIKRFFGGPGTQNMSWDDILAKWSQELQIFVRNVFDTIIQVIKDAGDEIIRVLREELQNLIHNAKEKAKDFIREKIPFGEKIVGKKQPTVTGPSELADNTVKAFKGVIPGSLQGAFTGMMPGLPGAITGAVKGAVKNAFEDNIKKTYKSVAAKNEQKRQEKTETKVVEPTKAKETEQKPEKPAIKETPPEKIVAQVKLDNTTTVQNAKVNLKSDTIKQVTEVLDSIKPSLKKFTDETQTMVDNAVKSVKETSSKNTEASEKLAKTAEKTAELAEKVKNKISDVMNQKISTKQEKSTTAAADKKEASLFEKTFGADGVEIINAITDANLRIIETTKSPKKDSEEPVKQETEQKKTEKITETAKTKDTCWEDFCKVMKEQIKIEKLPKKTELTTKQKQWGVYEGKYQAAQIKEPAPSAFEKTFGADGVELINAMTDANAKLLEASAAEKADTNELIQALDANRRATEELQKLLRNIDMNIQKGNQINDRGFATAANTEKSAPQLINVNNSSRNVVLNSSSSTNNFRAGMLNSPYAPV